MPRFSLFKKGSKSEKKIPFLARSHSFDKMFSPIVIESINVIAITLPEILIGEFIT